MMTSILALYPDPFESHNHLIVQLNLNIFWLIFEVVIYSHFIHFKLTTGFHLILLRKSLEGAVAYTA
jgi:hypothetical protein